MCHETLEVARIYVRHRFEKDGATGQPMESYNIQCARPGEPLTTVETWYVMKLDDPRSQQASVLECETNPNWFE